MTNMRSVQSNVGIQDNTNKLRIKMRKTKVPDLVTAVLGTIQISYPGVTNAHLRATL